MLLKYLLHEWIYLTTIKAAAQNKDNYHKIKIQKEVYEFISCGFMLYTLTIPGGLIIVHCRS